MSNTTADVKVNFAKAVGFESVLAAVLFSVIYVPLAIFYVFISIKKRSKSYITLVVFCLVRIVAYAIRAVLAGSQSAGEDKGLLTADLILLGAGFLGLLNSAYFLVLDRLSIHPEPLPGGPIAEVFRNKRVYHVATVAAIALSIFGTIKVSEGDSSGTTFRDVAAVIFLVLTVLQAYQTFILISVERSVGPPHGHSIGIKHGAVIFAAISVVLLVREVFNVATLGNSSVANNEAFFYPLVAAPELLVVLMFMTPGLVPRKSEASQRKLESQSRDWLPLERNGSSQVLSRTV